MSFRCNPAGLEVRGGGCKTESVAVFRFLSFSGGDLFKEIFVDLLLMTSFSGATLLRFVVFLAGWFLSGAEAMLCIVASVAQVRVSSALLTEELSIVNKDVEESNSFMDHCSFLRTLLPVLLHPSFDESVESFDCERR